MCVLIADGAAPAALRQVSAAGAFLETNSRPTLGSTVELHHPEAGFIRAEVITHAQDGVSLRFDRDGAAVAFALMVIAADMTKTPLAVAS